MEGADPDFTREFSRGDLIVAATNFGCGSSREHAAITLKAIGVGVVLAESFGRIFYRNADQPRPAGAGLPGDLRPGQALMCCSRHELGESAQPEHGAVLQAQPLSGYPLEIMRHGGIKPMMKSRSGGSNRTLTENGKAVLNENCRDPGRTRPIASPIRNAYIDFSKMTLSLVAVVTDVVRDGRPVVGYGFNSNGRYGQGCLIRERFMPRLLEADPETLLDRQRDNLDPGTGSGTA